MKTNGMENFVVAIIVMQFLILLVVLVMVSIYAYQYHNSGASITKTVVRDILPTGKDIPDIYHFHAKNDKSDKFLYDGTYYVLPMKNIQLSSKDISTNVDPFSLITDGYCTFKNDASYDYQFGKNLVKAVYHDDSTIYLVVPVSIIQDWLMKKLVTVQDSHYALNQDLVISGGIKSKTVEAPKEPEIQTLPIPYKGEIPAVVIH